MGIGPPLLPWLSMSRGPVLHLDHKTPTLLCGTSSERLVYIGESLKIWPFAMLIFPRLRGHRDQVTNIRFFPSTGDLPSTSTATAPGYLLTSGKDTFVKFWDLSTQHCVQTIVAHRSEVWSLDVNQEWDLFFTGSGEGEVKAWRVDLEALAAGLKETETGEVCAFMRNMRHV
jgi:WD40 repeat protein